jgi:hypothetical protein
VRFELPAPMVPLTDGTIRVRVPNSRDIAAIAEYTMTLGGLEGAWLPVAAGHIAGAAGARRR